ncbi:GNAT family N-acetyltransferase [Priestia endophytica]|uniref:GNAT family N-acetyltransferase n=1 Tax=Priestia endophytica TaxID=135735 RepID=UPI000DCA6623|nr:GNAT family N-acetyltransferase [Priestia endophytica]RAS81891.1 GNAT family N-acetyltransferase [Priestia endophytica]
MYRLVPKDYGKIHNILEESFKTPTFAFAIANHIIQGSIYINDIVNPSSGFLRTASGIYHVFGKANDLVFNKDFYSYFIEKIYRKENRFTVFTPSTEWESFFDDVFKPYVQKMRRSKYRFVSSAFHPKYKLSNSYNLKTFTPNTLRKSDNFNESYILEYWGTEDNFNKNGLGVCIMDRKNIVAECISIFHSGKTAEIDIITNPNYRGKGLGTIVGQEFIKQCLVKNVLPAWDCDINNESSKVLAHKLGFSNEEHYALYVLK